MNAIFEDELWGNTAFDDLRRIFEEVDKEDDEEKVNFAQAGRKIASSSQIYSRRVDNLYSLVSNTQELFSNPKKHNKSGKVSACGALVTLEEWHTCPWLERLSYKVKEAKTVKTEEGSSYIVPKRRLPLLLMPQQKDSTQNQYKICQCFLHQSGALLLEEKDGYILDEMLGEGDDGPEEVDEGYGAIGSRMGSGELPILQKSPREEERGEAEGISAEQERLAYLDALMSQGNEEEEGLVMENLEGMDREKMYNFQTQEVTMKVEKWHAYVVPKLVEQETRPGFNIHQQGKRLVDRLKDRLKNTNKENQESGEAIELYKILRHRMPWEVCRDFTAMLQLLNSKVVDLELVTEEALQEELNKSNSSAEEVALPVEEVQDKDKPRHRLKLLDEKNLVSITSHDVDEEY